MGDWLQRIKNHPLITALVMLVTLVSSLAAFNSSLRSLWQDFVHNPRVAINGEWQADITYGWSNTSYRETFNFMGDGEVLLGSASFLRVPRGIVEGNLQGDQVQWVTLVSQLNNNNIVRNVYRGRIEKDRLELILQIENSDAYNVPIVVTATRSL